LTRPTSSKMKKAKLAKSLDNLILDIAYYSLEPRSKTTFTSSGLC